MLKGRDRTQQKLMLESGNMRLPRNFNLETLPPLIAVLNNGASQKLFCGLKQKQR